MMRIEALSFFLEVAQCGSFSLAARRLYISQQGLSKSVAALEKELGVALFERTGKNLHLTDAGHDLLPLARSCVHLEQEIKDTMAHHHVVQGGDRPLEILAMSFTSDTFFFHMRKQLERAGLRNVILTEGTCEEIVSTLEADPHEKIGLILLPASSRTSFEEGTQLVFTPLLRSDIGVIGSKKLLSPRKKSMSVSELAQYPLAYYKEPALDAILREAVQCDAADNVIAHVSSANMLDEYIGSGRAISFWDSFSAHLGDDSGGVFIPLAPTLSFYVGFIYSKNLDEQGLSYIESFATCIKDSCPAYFAKCSCMA